MALTPVHAAESSQIEFTPESNTGKARQSPAADKSNRSDERLPPGRLQSSAQEQSGSIRTSAVLPKTQQRTLETAGLSPEVINALKSGEDPQAIIHRLGISQYSHDANTIKDKAYDIKQEKSKVAGEKIEKMKKEYPADDWNNRVLVGRSSEYDPPAAALTRGGKLEDVIEKFGFKNDPEETARLTELVNGGLARNQMYWS
jgi:hypothetical protein